MSLTYLLDTNIVSEPLRPTPHQNVLERLKRHEAEVAIAAAPFGTNCSTARIACHTVNSEQ